LEREREKKRKKTPENENTAREKIFKSRRQNLTLSILSSVINGTQRPVYFQDSNVVGVAVGDSYSLGHISERKDLIRLFDLNTMSPSFQTTLTAH